MPPITEPTAAARQVSGKNPQGLPTLNVLAKRTYQVRPDGRCVLADEQQPLALEPVFDPENEDLLLQDMDIFSFKPATDVIVKGHAFAPPGQGRFEASVRVGPHVKKLLVIGDRSCTLSSNGRIMISDPKPVEKVPLRYTHAYGGRDEAAEAQYGNPYVDLQPYEDKKNCDLSKASPFLYPRNPCGRGFLVEASAAAVEALRLPNLEDPLDPLTPERLAAGEPEAWPLMPLPMATDWVDYAWFPRLAYIGILPIFDPPPRPVAEVQRGFAPPGILEEAAPGQKFDFRMTNGASLGLQLPYLKGNEVCVLTHMHPKQREFRFRLPGDRPRIWTDGRKGKLNETQPVLHTLVIEPDEGRVSVVWCGAAQALRPYLPDELEKMPFRVHYD